METEMQRILQIRAEADKAIAAAAHHATEMDAQRQRGEALNQEAAKKNSEMQARLEVERASIAKKTKQLESIEKLLLFRATSVSPVSTAGASPASGGGSSHALPPALQAAAAPASPPPPPPAAAPAASPPALAAVPVAAAALIASLPPPIAPLLRGEPPTKDATDGVFHYPSSDEDVARSRRTPPACLHCGFMEELRVRCLPGPLGSKTLCNACGLRWRGGGKAGVECKQCGGKFTILACSGSACERKSAAKTEKRRDKVSRTAGHLARRAEAVAAISSKGREPAGGGRCDRPAKMLAREQLRQITGAASDGSRMDGDTSDGGSGRCGAAVMDGERRDCEYPGCQKSMVSVWVAAHSGPERQAAASPALRHPATPLAAPRSWQQPPGSALRRRL